MFDLVAIFSDPANIAALATLIAMEVVLGIDNLTVNPAQSDLLRFGFGSSCDIRGHPWDARTWGDTGKSILRLRRTIQQSCVCNRFANQVANRLFAEAAKRRRSTKQLKNSKVLAEEAVISEPVSARWFPVPRENTGKFADFGLEIARAPRFPKKIQSLATEFPSHQSREHLLAIREPEVGNSESDPDITGSRGLVPGPCLLVNNHLE